MSGEWQVTHLLNECRSFLRTLTHVATDLMAAGVDRRHPDLQAHDLDAARR